MVSEICLLEPQFTEVVQSYEKELESRGYRASSIKYLLFSIKRIFNSSLDGQRSYSVSKSQQWLEMQRNRLLAKEIKPKYYSDMNTARTV